MEKEDIEDVRDIIDAILMVANWDTALINRQELLFKQCVRLKEICDKYEIAGNINEVL